MRSLLYCRSHHDCGNFDPIYTIFRLIATEGGLKAGVVRPGHKPLNALAILHVFGDYPLGIRRLTLLDSHLYMRYMTLKAWRLIAIFAVSACLLLATTVTYGLWAYGNNLDAFLDAAPICYADHRKYDSIAAANAIGRLDFISFLLTAGGILFAIFAFVGFWVVRREVVDEASRVASNEARKVAQRYYNNDENRGGTNGGDKSKEGRYKKGSSSTARRDTSEVPTAGAVEETGAEDV